MSEEKKYYDWIGNELKVGDVVLFISGSESKYFQLGSIIKLNEKFARVSQKSDFYGSWDINKSYHFLVKADDKAKLLYKLGDTSGGRNGFQN